MIRIQSTIAKVVLVAVVSVLPAGLGAAQAPGGQRVFDSPESATKALIAAARADDEVALIEIFGPNHRDVFDTADKVRDRENRELFAKAADEYQLLRPEDDGSMRLVVGYDAWPFPIPLVKQGSSWRFDTDAGREELLNRRIGAYELAAIATLRGYVAAQRQYALKPRDGTNVRQFARKIRSAPEKKDGLYWDVDPMKGDEVSPFGPLIGDAGARVQGTPYNGYRFKILTRQGPAAPAGRYDYVINGRMIGGFAMVAFPAQYGITGVKTFIVNHYDVVYEKDLGPKTASIAAAITEYNPGPSWQPVQEQ